MKKLSLVLLTLSFLAATAGAETPQAALARAEKLYDARQFSKAADLAGKTWKADPALAEAGLLQADALAAGGTPEKAVALYDKIIQDARRPKTWFWRAHHGKGLALLRLERRRDALSAFEAAVKANPTPQAYGARAAALVDLARAADKSGNKKDARAALREALNDLKRATYAAPGNAALWNLKAAAHAGLGQKKESCAAAKRACNAGDCAAQAFCR